MTTTTTQARPRGSRRLSLSWVVPGAFALAACLLGLGLSRAMPDRTSLTFENRTRVAVTVHVNNASRHGWVAVGTVDPESRATMREVIDQGDVWRFRFEVGPDRIGEIRRTSAELRAAHGKVTIPADAADELSARRR